MTTSFVKQNCRWGVSPWPHNHKSRNNTGGLRPPHTICFAVVENANCSSVVEKDGAPPVLPPLRVVYVLELQCRLRYNRGVFPFPANCVHTLTGRTLRSSQSNVRNVLSRFLYRRKKCETYGQQDPMQPVGIVNHAGDSSLSKSILRTMIESRAMHVLATVFAWHGRGLGGGMSGRQNNPPRVR